MAAMEVGAFPRGVWGQKEYQKLRTRWTTGRSSLTRATKCPRSSFDASFHDARRVNGRIARWRSSTSRPARICKFRNFTLFTNAWNNHHSTVLTHLTYTYETRNCIFCPASRTVWVAENVHKRILKYFEPCTSFITLIWRHKGIFRERSL